MLVWPAPHVPAIHGHGHALRLYDPRTGHLMTTGGPARGSVALCGILPEGGLRLRDVAHLVAVDLAVRAWRDAGLTAASVAYLAESGSRPEADLADAHSQLAALGVLPPDVLWGTTDAAAAVKGAVERLEAAGSGRTGGAADGPTDLGASGPELASAVQVLTHLDGTCDLLAGDHAADVRPEVVESFIVRLSGNEHPVQRILAIGGRPAEGLVQPPGNGLDPQASVAGLLGDGAPPSAIRLLVLARHYRSTRPYPPSALDDASARLERWTAAVSGNGGPPADELVGQVRAALADDLDTPRALGAVDAWAERSLSVGQPGGVREDDLVEGAPGVVARAVDALLGVRL